MSSICSRTGVCAQSNHFCVERSFMASWGRGWIKALMNK